MTVYKNFSYRPYEDNDGDCIKIWHEVVHLDDCLEVIESTTLDRSPYCLVTEEEFRHWVDTGELDYFGKKA